MLVVPSSPSRARCSEDDVPSQDGFQKRSLDAHHSEGCYADEEEKEEEEFLPGDMVIRDVNPGKYSDWMAHYGVVSECRRVIHKMPGMGVIEEDMAAGEWRFKSRHGPLAAQTARMILEGHNMDYYNLFFANCENFARYCCESKNVSYQAEGAGAGAVAGAGTGAYSGVKVGIVSTVKKACAYHVCAYYGSLGVCVSAGVYLGFLLGGALGCLRSHVGRRR